MIKVTVITTAGKKTDIFEENKTPKDILQHFDIDYEAATNTLDGVKLDVAGMNKSLRDLGITKDCRLSSIVKIDNAATITITGAAAVLTSAVKLDDWKRVAEFMPEELQLVDEDTEEILFKVAVGEGPGSMNEYGVVFGSVVGTDGKATVTVLLDPETEDKKELVRKTVGSALLDLNKIEAEVPGMLEEIAKMEEEIDAHINVI